MSKAVEKFEEYITSKIVVGGYQISFCDLDSDVLDELIEFCEGIKSQLHVEDPGTILYKSIAELKSIRYSDIGWKSKFNAVTYTSNYMTEDSLFHIISEGLHLGMSSLEEIEGSVEKFYSLVMDTISGRRT